MIIFVYDNLMLGGCHHKKISGARLIGFGQILSKQHVMIVGNGDTDTNWPALVAVPGRGTYIKGELYEVSDAIMEDLKHFYSYPNYYIGDRVSVWVRDTCYQAFMFVLPRTAMTASVYQVTNGTWNANTSKPDRSESMTYDELWGEKDEDEKWSIMDNPLPQESRAADVEDVEDTEDAEEPVNNEFVVEKGFYITSDMGDQYGPYDTLADALADLPSFTEELRDSEILTIGFRLVRSEYTEVAGDYSRDLHA